MKSLSFHSRLIKNKRICTKRAPKVDTPVVHFFFTHRFCGVSHRKKSDASLFIAQYNSSGQARHGGLPPNSNGQGDALASGRHGTRVYHPTATGKEHISISPARQGGLSPNSSIQGNTLAAARHGTGVCHLIATGKRTH